MEKLYRIISFPAFINLVEQKKERYVSPATWEDTHEGYLLRLFEHEKYRKEILKKLFADFSGNNISELIYDYMRLWTTRWLCFAQCWSKLDESDALWRIYSYNKMSIRIRTNRNKICRLINEPEVKNKYYFDIKNIVYDADNPEDFDKQFEIFSNTAEPTEPFFHKRKAFEHEQEIRVILTRKDDAKTLSRISSSITESNFKLELQNKGYPPHNLTEESLNILVKYISDNQINFKNNMYFRDNLMIDIPNLADYIEGVMVHPQAEDWIVSLVESICKRNGLYFEGKSNMYFALS